MYTTVNTLVCAKSQFVSIQRSVGRRELRRGCIQRSCTPQKRRLRSNSEAFKESPFSKPMKLKSPRRRLISSPSSTANKIKEDPSGKLVKKCWNPRVLDFARHVSNKRKLGACMYADVRDREIVSMEKVKQQVIDWATMILGMHQSKKKITGSTSPLQHLQNLYSNKQVPSGSKIWIGKYFMIFHAYNISILKMYIDRQAMVVTFRALKIKSFQHFRRGSWSAVEILEAELREAASNLSLTSEEGGAYQSTDLTALEIYPSQENSTVRIDHMALPLSKTFRSPIVDTIQSLLSINKLYLLCREVFPWWEEGYNYWGGVFFLITDRTSWNFGIFKHAVLNDQGLFKLVQSRDGKFKRVMLKLMKLTSPSLCREFVYFGIVFSNFAQMYRTTCDSFDMLAVFNLQHACSIHDLRHGNRRWWPSLVCFNIGILQRLSPNQPMRGVSRYYWLFGHCLKQNL
ncbi:hypothetical protein F3Y22_tig00110879pilonHSYRG00093 [Hibiscus syriacus]|uniref:Uncharacterized protein n=1 Tax=Hibiscus syriacus TaxID=106335 RepID=A0A6A2ZLK0_HIBSY|nr:hypothetical protein F3Y22_tig00110879pilonHSYRG00093 [Hibiscus syriacus]